jgi:hypothetical protein
MSGNNSNKSNATGAYRGSNRQKRSISQVVAVDTLFMEEIGYMTGYITGAELVAAVNAGLNIKVDLQNNAKSMRLSAERICFESKAVLAEAVSLSLDKKYDLALRKLTTAKSNSLNWLDKYNAKLKNYGAQFSLELADQLKIVNALVINVNDMQKNVYCARILAHFDVRNAELYAKANEHVGLARNEWDVGDRSAALQHLLIAHNKLQTLNFDDECIANLNLAILRRDVAEAVTQLTASDQAMKWRYHETVNDVVGEIIALALQQYKLRAQIQNVTLYYMHKEMLIQTLMQQFMQYWTKFDGRPIPMTFVKQIATRICSDPDSGIKPIGYQKLLTGYCMFTAPSVSIASIEECLTDIAEIFSQYQPLLSIIEVIPEIFSTTSAVVASDTPEMRKLAQNVICGM